MPIFSDRPDIRLPLLAHVLAAMAYAIACVSRNQHKTGDGRGEGTGAQNIFYTLEGDNSNIELQSEGAGVPRRLGCA